MMSMSLSLSALHVASLLAMLGLVIGAAVKDIYHYRVPSNVMTGIVLLFPVFVMTSPQPLAWEQHCAVAVLMALPVFIMRWGGMFRRQDMQMLILVALWVGPHGLGLFLVSSAMVGLLITTGVFLRHYARRRTKRRMASAMAMPVPYGLAFAVGGTIAVLSMAQMALLPL